jgi:hypothetical protein
MHTPHVLIVSIPGDVHADAVRWAVDGLGHGCRRWHPSELEHVAASVMLSDGELALQLEGPEGEIDGRAIRSAWLRRFRAPTPPADLTPGDRTVAARESERFLRGLHFALGPEVLWANAPAAQRVASLKLPQLAAARRVGLRVPRTVMTNDAQTARAFVRAARGRAIYKGFAPAVWMGARAEEQFSLGTVVVREEDLEDDDVLRLSPGIFQDLVAKQFELRVTIFGRTCVAARISEQDEIDWRRTHVMNVSPHRLPARVEAQLFALMDDLGLTMGTADLIVTPEGEYVFLEINEQGQFLWVELRNPEIALLDPFARFLASGRRDFRAAPVGSERMTFADYLKTDPAHRLEVEATQQSTMSQIVVSEQPQGEQTT